MQDNTKPINVLSYFDGLSGAHLALDKIGIKINHYFASEIDKPAITVTNANYPDTIQLGDVTKINFDALPKIDLLIGGFPCQSFSKFGKGLNFDDPRGKLFFECIKALKELKPKYFLFENVKMKKEWRDYISNLVGVEPIQIDSGLLTGQRRVRNYWTNIPNVKQPEDKKIKLQDVIGDYTEKDVFHEKHLKWWHEKQEFQIRRYFSRLDPEKAMTLIASQGSQQGGTVLSCGFDENLQQENFRNLSPEECEMLQGIPRKYTDHVSRRQRFKMVGNGFSVDTIAHILQGMKEVYK
jgi:site-specific DNA-cytosine methylase